MSRLIPLLIIAFVWVSCDSTDDIISFDSGLEITFSNDTVSFDTLLTDSRSPTQRLTVYNPNNSRVVISEIILGNGDNSDYSMIVNGKNGTQQLNEELGAGDSLLILVEVNIDPQNQNLPYIVKDSIIFNWNGNSEHVKLVSWGQDGNRIQNQSVCDEVWTNTRPYIVSDTLLIPPNCQLTLNPGTTIYMENDAVIFVQGSLVANGDSANHVTIRNARFDGIYDDVPGQWDGIYFLEGSQNNQITYTDIFNGQVGLRLGAPDDDDIPEVVVSHTQIYNMSFAGILAFTSDLEATNCLIYNCGTYLVGNFAGGNYTYRHCTFSNEPSLFVNDQPTVQFSDNIVISETELLTDDLNIELSNSIVWGSGEEELLINNGGGETVIAVLTANIIKSATTIEGNQTSQAFNFPGFTSPFAFDYTLDSLSNAINAGIDLGVELDILGANRDQTPDIGAYEYIPKEE